MKTIIVHEYNYHKRTLDKIKYAEEKLEKETVALRSNQEITGIGYNGNLMTPNQTIFIKPKKINNKLACF